MIDTIKRYSSLDEAQRSTSYRSWTAFNRGEYSQYEVRARDLENGETVFVGGLTCDLYKSPFADAEIVAQYSGGYRV